MAAKRERWTPLLCSYPDSKRINSVSLGAETLFLRLLAKCDDQSNFDGSPTQLLCRLYADRFEQGQVSVSDMERWRAELVTAGLLKQYCVDGVDYLHVVNCKKHLRSDIKPDIRYPDYTEGLEKQEHIESGTNTERIRNGYGSSYSTTDATTDTKTKERNRSKKFIKPSVQEVTAYAESIGFNLDGQQFVDFYESKGWKIGNSPMKDWRAAVRTWKSRKPTKPKAVDIGAVVDALEV